MSELILKKKPKEYVQLYEWFKNKSEKNRKQVNQIPDFAGSYPAATKTLYCPLPLKKLNVISIKEMKLEQLQKDCYIKLRFILPCFKMVAIHCLCEDHTGNDCIEMSIYNFELKGHHYDDYFNTNTVVYIKEPFYKTSATGTHIIRVDNPKDIIFQNDPEANQLEKLGQTVKIDQTDRAEEFRLKGLDLMNRNLFVHAYLLYSEAIQCTKQPELKIKFLLNKAIVCSKLNLIKQYNRNVQYVFLIDPQNKKALYHKIKYLILIELYDKAKNLLQQYKSLIDKNTETELLKFLEIEKSFKENKMNWFRALKYHEVGEYFSEKIQIGNSPFGLGLIAKTNIRVGEVLIVERPLLMMKDENTEKDHPFGFFTSTTKNDIKMKQNMLMLQKVKLLTTSDRLASNIKGHKREQFVIKSMQDVNDVMETNWLELSQFTEVFLASPPCKDSAIYEKICMLNHCCECNCQRFNIGATMIVYSVKEISEGEELFITYKQQPDYIERQRALMHWNIHCKCIFCQEQQYQLEHHKQKSKVKSDQLKKLRLFQDFQKNKRKSTKINELTNYIDPSSLALMLIFGANILKTSEMLRRFLPMSQKQSVQILGSYLIPHQNK